VSRPSQQEWCKPHTNPLPCEQCATEANYDGDLFTSRPAVLATPVDFHPLTAAFLCFHERNPHILLAILAELRELWKAGVRRCAIATVYEVVRWRLTLNAYADMARDGDELDGKTFSMSNSHKTYYVRLIEHMHPTLVGFFDKQSTAEAENDLERWLPVAVRITREAGQS
jgi:hypothetical protein